MSVRTTKHKQRKKKNETTTNRSSNHRRIPRHTAEASYPCDSGVQRYDTMLKAKER